MIKQLGNHPYLEFNILSFERIYTGGHAIVFQRDVKVGPTCTLNVAHQLVEIELQMFYYTRHIQVVMMDFLKNRFLGLQHPLLVRVIHTFLCQMTEFPYSFVCLFFLKKERENLH